MLRIPGREGRKPCALDGVQGMVRMIARTATRSRRIFVFVIVRDVDGGMVVEFWWWCMQQEDEERERDKC